MSEQISTIDMFMALAVILTGDFYVDEERILGFLEDANVTPERLIRECFLHCFQPSETVH
jgi:hypothetical protein